MSLGRFGKQLGRKEQAQVRGQQPAGSLVLLLALSRPKREIGDFRMPTLRWVKSQVWSRVSSNRFFKDKDGGRLKSNKQLLQVLSLVFVGVR